MVRYESRGGGILGAMQFLVPYVEPPASTQYPPRHILSRGDGLRISIAGASSLAIVLNDLTAAYLLQGSVATDSIASYNVRVSIGADVVGNYNILSSTAVQSSLAGAYNVVGVCQAEHDASYSIRGAIQSNGAYSYFIRGFVQVTANASYAIVANVTTDFAADYLVQGAAVSSFVGGYSILGGSSIYPFASQVLQGIVYGPSGNDYIGTLVSSDAAAIATAVRNELAVELARIDTTISSRMLNGTVIANVKLVNDVVLLGNGSDANPWRSS